MSFFDLFKRIPSQPKPNYDYNIKLEEKLLWLCEEFKPEKEWSMSGYCGVYSYEKLIKGILFRYHTNYHIDRFPVLSCILLVDDSYIMGKALENSLPGYNHCYPEIYSGTGYIKEGPWWNTINDLIAEYDIKNKIITHRQLEAKAKREKAAKEYQSKMKCKMKRESIIDMWNKGN